MNFKLHRKSASSIIATLLLSTSSSLATPPRVGLSQASSNLAASWSQWGGPSADQSLLWSQQSSRLQDLADGLVMNGATAGSDAGRMNSFDASTLPISDSQFQDIIKLINQAMNDINATIGHATDGIITQWGRTNDFALKAVNPRNMFMVSAGMASGAVIGGSLAKLFVDGAVAGTKHLAKLISGRARSEKNEAGTQLFEGARKEYLALEKSIPDLEAALESSFVLLRGADQLNRRLLSVMDQSLEEALLSSERGETPSREWLTVVQLAGTTLSQVSQGGRLAEISQAISREKEATSAWRGLISELRQQLRDIDASEYFELESVSMDRYCHQVDELYATLAGLDARMQSARTVMISHEREWSDGIYEQFNRDAKRLRSAARARRAHQLESVHSSGATQLKRYDRDVILNLKAKAESDCRTLIGHGPSSSNRNSVCGSRIFLAHSEKELTDLLGLTSAPETLRPQVLTLFRQVQVIRAQEAGMAEQRKDFLKTIDGHSEEILSSNSQLFLNTQLIREQQSSMMAFIQDLRREQSVASGTLISDHLVQIRGQIQEFCKERQIP